MPLAFLIVVASASGVIVTLLALAYPTSAGEPPPVSQAVAEEIARDVVRHARVREMLQRRLDPAVATGLALTVALAVAIAGVVLLGLLAYLMRTSSGLVHVDARVGQWGADHASGWSTRLIQLVTDLAGTPFVVTLLVVLLVVELRRAPNRWLPVFLLVVVGGEIAVVQLVKAALDRARPTFNPIAASLGPSFPSGHSATAAAAYAAAALVLSRRRSPRVRALLAGSAAAIAVAVACSRVMLGVHWMSDVIAGLGFGWAWFAACSVAFGGRLLELGAPVEAATRAVERRSQTS